ncbi:MAG: LCP family protein, partial [Oscillospiraceae bacterium]
MRSFVKIFFGIAALSMVGAGAAAAVTLRRGAPPLPVRPPDFGIAAPGTAGSAGEKLVTEPLGAETFGLLLCGIDNTKTLADVVLYAQLDTVNHRARLLQIPRDIFVGEQNSTGKLNAACQPFRSVNPAAQIQKIVEQQFGLPVDGCVSITLSGVRALVDAVGGVPIHLPREIDYLPGQTLPAGEQRLTGEQSEWLLRYRKGYKMADLDRLEAQKLFLAGAFAAAKDVGRMQALSIAAKNFGHLKTDLPLSVASSLISEGMKLTEKDIEMMTIPTYGASYHGYSVLCVNRFRLAELLNGSFRSENPVSPWELFLQYPPEPQS